VGHDRLLRDRISIYRIAPDGLSVVLHGSDYALNNLTVVSQSAKFSLLCSTSSSEPELISYNGSVMEVKWNTPSGCIAKDSDQSDKPQEDETKGGSGSGGSSIGWYIYS
jgi:autophagy-related protein 27